jgi:hypothetical protein
MSAEFDEANFKNILLLLKSNIKSLASLQSFNMAVRNL